MKIADFGLAINQMRTATSGVGTPAYMAPEILIDIKEGGKADLFAGDVYSLGVILWQLWFKVPDVPV